MNKEAAMTNPFDDESGTFLALTNTEGQYSLWPAHIDMPDGWSTAHGPALRSECLEHVEQNWTDMRPASLVRATDADR
jgi:uncharacterized protein YbdZ (MbtH family)